VARRGHGIPLSCFEQIQAIGLAATEPFTDLSHVLIMEIGMLFKCSNSMNKTCAERGRKRSYMGVFEYAWGAHVRSLVH